MKAFHGSSTCAAVTAAAAAAAAVEEEEEEEAGAAAHPDAHDEREGVDEAPRVLRRARVLHDVTGLGFNRRFGLGDLLVCLALPQVATRWLNKKIRLICGCNFKL